MSVTTVTTFPHGYKDGWELNLNFGKYTLRFARYQIALWKDLNPLFNKLF